MSGKRPFVVSQQAQGRWMNLGDLACDGSRIMVKFDRDLGMVVKRSIDPRIVQAVEDSCIASRNIWKKGTLLGTGKKHWLPVARFTPQQKAAWERELGPMRENQSAWRRRLNDPDYRNMRTSDYKI